MKRILMLAVVSFLVLAGPAAAGELTVASAATCTGVVDHEPLNPGVEFASTVGKVFCLTRIEGALDPVQVSHEWYYGDVHRASVTLAVRSSSFRTYSSKIIQDHEVGTWRVEVLGPDGELLETLKFEITAADVP